MGQSPDQVLFRQLLQVAVRITQVANCYSEDQPILVRYMWSRKPVVLLRRNFTSPLIL